MTGKIEIKSIDLIPSNIVLAKLTIAGQDETLITSVSDNVTQYLMTDRIDAYVAGLFYFAMQSGLNFYSNIPISEDLYYNLQFHLIDSLYKANPTLHRITINAPIKDFSSDSTLPKKIVATGISCGVDSLFTVATNSNKELKNYNLNHLAFFDVGASMLENRDMASKILFEERLKKAETFAEAMKYDLITVESNLHKIINHYIPYSHISNHSYMASFCILILQKGIGKYYYSAGHTYNDFKLRELNGDLDTAYYDLLLLNMFSINGTRIYSSGASHSRVEKTKFICDYKPAYKYLNVCVNHSQNDSTCFKCLRTLLTLDAVSNINNFREVFDIDFYIQNRRFYIRRMYYDALIHRNSHYKEIMPYYKQNLTLSFRIWCVVSEIINKIKRKLGLKYGVL